MAAMVKSSSSVWLAAAAVCILAVALAPRAESAITCVQVAKSLTPCLTYLKGTGGAPPQPCCAGVTNLNKLAQTTPDRKAACNCLKTVARSVNGLNVQTAAGLPGKCGVNIPYAISMSTNCDNVK